MLKKIALLVVMFALPLGAMAQTKFAHMNSQEVIITMPEYTKAQADLDAMSKEYQTEMQRTQEEFNKKYQEFLAQADSLPKNIAERRQKELQEAMENGVKFRNQVADLLNKAQQELEKPLITKLDSAISLVGMERGYDVIINTGERGFPFINKTTGEDVTLLVKEKIATIKP